MTNFVRIWVLFSALLVAAGWILSLVHQLNAGGYLVFFSLVALFFWGTSSGKKAGLAEAWRPKLHKIWRRYKRPLPAIFLMLALMSLIGGFLYVSMDGDALAYRTPRVLHWLGHEQWHWIRSADARVNIAGCNFEWLTVPLLLFTHTDQYFFLFNIGCFLMLPGLIYSVFIRLGVRRRVAWWWMWLLSSGWCFILQAASTHNDSYAAVYALAAVDLALRAREKKSSADLWLSLLAVAYLTGIKQTNIPLALLWLIAAWPARQLFFSRPLISLAVSLLGLLISFLPMAVLNFRYTGSWTGITPNMHEQLDSPVWGIIGNAFCLPWENLMPPFIPWADRWNAAMAHFVTTPFGSHFASFEEFGHLQHTIGTETAGIGLPICVLVFISVAFMMIQWRSPSVRGLTRLPSPPYIRVLRWLPWFLLVLFMAKVGVFENARILSPYYVFFFPSLLVLPVSDVLLRRRWWRLLCVMVMLIAAGMLVVSREHPMFPVQTVIAKLRTRYPHSKVLTTFEKSYGFRATFENLRHLFVKSLPPDPSLVVGYVTLGDMAEPGLWLPWPRLKVERFLPDDTLSQFQQAGVRYVMVDNDIVSLKNETIEQWASRHGGQLIDQVAYLKDPANPPSYVYLVRLGTVASP